MAITTYAELVTAVSDELNRTDQEAYYPNYIALFEARANRHLRAPQMETTATATTTDNAVALPDDFSSAREIYIDGQLVRPMSPQEVRETGERFTTGNPLGYAIVDEAIRFVPAQDDGTEVGMVYRAKVPALTATATSNWLLAGHPDAYLYGVCAYVLRKLRDTDGFNEMIGIADTIIDEINADGVRRNTPAGPLVARSGIFG